MNLIAKDRATDTLSETENSRASLLAIIKKESYRYSPTAEFTLSSGVKSNFYFDMKMTMLDPSGAHLIADVLAETLSHHKTRYVAGLELGAVPLIVAACMRGCHGLIVRKDKKGHGTKKLVEGPLPPKGTEVIVLDDVTTKGDSVLTAVHELRAAGCKVRTVVTLVDREDEARDRLAAEEITLVPVFTLADFHTA